jgi:hypothetical protein
MTPLMGLVQHPCCRRPLHFHPHTSRAPPSQVRGELDSDARRKVNTLVITDVHARDIVDSFVRDSVMDASEFAWESQLRFYWDRAQVGRDGVWVGGRTGECMAWGTGQDACSVAGADSELRKGPWRAPRLQTPCRTTC